VSSATPTLLAERAALCDTLTELGPDAPTLCEGWQTLDLAAHLIAREARADAAVGLILPGPFARHLENVMDHYKERGYDTLVGMLRTGPPRMHRMGPLAAANVNENFVHHEDARRPAGRGPRDLDAEENAILWKMLGFGRRLAKRRLKGAGLVLRAPDGSECIVSDTQPSVTLTGAVGELVLFMSGRKEAAVVEHEGDPEAVAIVLAAHFGI
jgi:uncharacterized protein (TIGR03085 family)